MRNPFRSVDTSMSLDSGTNEGKHRKKKDRDEGRCGHTWSTRPEGNTAIPGAHYDHWCGLVPNHRGRHQCMSNWNCGETQ
jgi:hypothetical protein